MIMPSSGGEIQELARVKKPDVISMAQTPCWTPDGRYLLYTVTRANKPYEPAETKTELWRLDIRTKEAKSLGPAIVPVLTLAIHPDGKRIAFDSGLPKVELWVMENFLERD
jgi:Tol biopolymer transport system component